MWAADAPPIVLFDYPPPALYDVPYTGPGNLLIVPDASAVCIDIGVKVKPDHVIYGCSWWTLGGCLIVLPKVLWPITQADQDMVRRVESANCNGWPRGDRE